MTQRVFTPLQPRRAERRGGLEAFYTRSREAASWLPADLDWNAVGDLGKTRTEVAWILASQSIGTEQVGLLVAAKMLAEVDDYDARAILALQVADEAKHSDLFERYVRAVGGEPAGFSESVEDLDISMSKLQEEDSVGLYFVHTFLECLALDEFGYLQAAFPHDILGEIYRRVARDEARHVAFGLIFLRDWAGQSGAVDKAKIDLYLDLAKRIGGINEQTISGLSSLSGAPADSIREDLESKALARMRYLQGTTTSPIG